MTIKETLSRYPGLNAEWWRLLAKLEAVEKSTAPATADLDAIERQINATLDEMHEIEDMISNLDDPLERVLLQLRYMDGEHGKPMKWKNVAKRIRGDDSAKDILFVHRLHRQALDHLAELAI